jgi:hypothetical protein
MKLALFRELVDLNRAFAEVIHGLEQMEKVAHFQRDLIRYARADVEIARVDVNREFFDNFESLVEDDASWAYKFQREYTQKARDPDDIYFDIKDCEERRMKKGLPPRIVILPGWNMSDEERCDEEQVAKKKRAAKKKAGAINRRGVSLAKGKRRAEAVVAAASKGGAER